MGGPPPDGPLRLVWDEPLLRNPIFGNSRQTISKGRSKPRPGPEPTKGRRGGLNAAVCALHSAWCFGSLSLHRGSEILSRISDRRGVDFARAWVPYGAGPFSPNRMPMHALRPAGPGRRFCRGLCSPSSDRLPRHVRAKRSPCKEGRSTARQAPARGQINDGGRSTPAPSMHQARSLGTIDARPWSSR
jgi:hypothetical protein